MLRAGLAAGLVGVTHLTADSAAAKNSRSAFSRSLQTDDRIRVRFQPRSPDGDPATEPIPEDCLDGEPQDFQILIVRGIRDGIDLGYRGLFVPEDAIATETETPTETQTTPETTPETETPSDNATETTPGSETEAAALQAETTPGNETETETTPGNATATETTPGTETTTETTPTETTEPAQLPEIRIGEWYRVTSATRCDSMFDLALKTAEAPETTPGGVETTAEE